jgi:hypothetical protein
VDRDTRRSVAGVAVYYILLIGANWLLSRYVPAWAELFAQGRLEELSRAPLDLSAPPTGSPLATSWLSAGAAMVGALLLVIPVAWVYIITKRNLSYDPSVVQTIIILPIAVAGIVLVVQHSLTLAFSLAGIVAAVRFRNTLKDTKDAVYVFLAIGVGLSAGVQAFAIAVTMSVVFNLVVLGLWRFNVGNIYATAGTPSDAGSTYHGTVHVRGGDPTEVAPLVEGVLTADTKKWQRVDDVDDGLAYLVQFKKKKNPPPVVVETIRMRGARFNVHVEYVPHGG